MRSLSIKEKCEAFLKAISEFAVRIQTQALCRHGPEFASMVEGILDLPTLLTLNLTSFLRENNFYNENLFLNSLHSRFFTNCSCK